MQKHTEVSFISLAVTQSLHEGRQCFQPSSSQATACSPLWTQADFLWDSLPRNTYSWYGFLTPKILIHFRQVMCPHHSKLQLSSILDQLTCTQVTDVPPPGIPHTRRCSSRSLPKQTRGAAAPSLPVSHTNIHSSVQSCSKHSTPVLAQRRPRAEPLSRAPIHSTCSPLTWQRGLSPGIVELRLSFLKCTGCYFFVAITSSNTVWACNIKTAWVYIQRDHK